jgi:double-stranded uracil-DNA glycosylase
MVANHLMAADRRLSTQLQAKRSRHNVATSGPARRIEGAGFRAMNGLPDILANDLDVVFCGLNPGLQAAASGHHFAGRGNRFWLVLFSAGFTSRLFEPTDDRLLLSEGCGLTAVVARPTASADEVSVGEFTAAADALDRKIETYQPRLVAFLGKKAYGAIVGRSTVEWGRQNEMFGSTGAWVLPNPSGRNRGFSLDELILAYRELRVATGRTEPKSI